MMTPIHHILAKEQTYASQMLAIKDKVLLFAKSRGWSPLRRGRRAHASIHGLVNGLNGVIDIEMAEVNWDLMPNALQPDTSFDLWCSASLDRAGHRLFADSELFWTAPFAGLSEAVDLFLVQAWMMLTQLGNENLLEKWPGPSENPDGPPNFGPPRRRLKSTLTVSAHQGHKALAAL